MEVGELTVYRSPARNCIVKSLLLCSLSVADSCRNPLWQLVWGGMVFAADHMRQRAIHHEKKRVETTLQNWFNSCPLEFNYSSISKGLILGSAFPISQVLGRRRAPLCTIAREGARVRKEKGWENDSNSPERKSSLGLKQGAGGYLIAISVRGNGLLLLLPFAICIRRGRGEGV